jgi:hypothetical protein
MKRCAVTGRRHARAARSNLSARRHRRITRWEHEHVLEAVQQFSSVSMRTRRRCASDAGPSGV